MDRGRHRAVLSAAVGGASLLALVGSLSAQPPPLPTPAASVSPAPTATATATPWVQASPPSTPAPAKPPSVLIRVDKDSRYFLGNEKDALPADVLGDRLRKLREEHGDDLRVILRADKDTNYEAITTAMDRAREAGLKNVSFTMPPGSKASSPSPSPSPSTSPSREEIAKAMSHKREEELAKAASPTPAKPPHADPQLSPEEREAYERNLTLWLAMPPDERQALRGQATERIREETEKAYASLGLNLNDDQREVFALRYRQERRRLEREIQEKAAAERARRLPEIMDRLKHEFPVTTAVSTPKPSPKPAATHTPTATATPSPAPAK